MTRNKKILIGCSSLIVVGALLFVIGFIAIAYFAQSDPAYEQAEAEGTAFGKDVTQSTCMSEGFKRSKDIGMLDISKSVVIGNFVEACLKNSSAVVGFCDGVPGMMAAGSEWIESECRKAGLDPAKSGCIGVAKAKQRFCRF